MRKIRVCMLALCLCGMVGCSKKEAAKPIETTTAEVIEETTASREETTEAVAMEETDFVPESYEETAPVQDAGKVELQITQTDSMYPVSTYVGYSFKALRPMDHDTSLEEFNDVPTIQDILSGEYWSGDQVVHRHQSPGLEEEPGFYNDNCWIEEYVDVQVYLADGLDKGWVYDEGEDFTDWLDGLAEQAAFGEDSRNIKHEYLIDGKEWTVFYTQRNLAVAPKDDFSQVQCYGYTKEDNGDYVLVTLKHMNYPTINTDDHVPTADERMETAKQSMEAILATIKKD